MTASMKSISSGVRAPSSTGTDDSTEDLESSGFERVEGVEGGLSGEDDRAGKNRDIISEN